MRRVDREITDSDEITSIIGQCRACRVAMVDENGLPYLIPMNFGYERTEGGITLYFHSSPKGRKMEILQSNPEVCIEMDVQLGLIRADQTCKHGFSYMSVIIRGRAEAITAPCDKIHALSCLMKHQTGERREDFSEAAVNSTAVFRVVAETMTAKARQEEQTEENIS